MKLLVAVTALFLVAACGSDSAGSGDGGPEDAVAQMLSSMEAGSCAGVKEVAVTPEAIDCEQIESLEGAYADDGVDVGDLSFSAGEIVDGSTTVTVSGSGQPDETWQAERVGGSWRVLFDSVE